MATMVVQLGLATMPLGMRARAAALTSGTTRGTSGSIRQADELSMTTAPAAANRGASSVEAVGADREQGEVEPGDVGGGGVLDHHLAAPEGDAATRRPGRGEQPEVVDGERPLLEDRPHDRPDLAGGSDDCHTHGAPVYGPSRTGPPSCRADRDGRRPASRQASSKAACRARTASSAASARTMHEIRIDEVEIISMLMPAAARVSKVRAVTPGWVFIPAPTSETRATSASLVTPVAPSSGTRRLAHLGAHGQVVRRAR